MKFGCDVREYYAYRHEVNRRYHKGIDFKTFQSLRRKGIPLNDFCHYKSMLDREFPEKAKDPYWTTFKSKFDFFHKEHEIAQKAQNIAIMKKAKEREDRLKKYRMAIKKFSKWDCNFDGLHVYIPKTFEDIENQADKLHQCLIDNDYISEVINKNLVLVFIKEGDQPLATASLYRKNAQDRTVLRRRARSAQLPAVRKSESRIEHVHPKIQCGLEKKKTFPHESEGRFFPSKFFFILLQGANHDYENLHPKRIFGTRILAL